MNKNTPTLGIIEREVNEIKEKLKSLEKSRDTYIADDLQATTPGFKNSYIFSYRQIAERYDVPISKIQKIAKENGIERINSKKLG